MWQAQVIVMTEFGNFSGRKLIVDDEKFKTLCDLSPCLLVFHFQLQTISPFESFIIASELQGSQ